MTLLTISLCRGASTSIATVLSTYALSAVKDSILRFRDFWVYGFLNLGKYQNCDFLAFVVIEIRV